MRKSHVSRENLMSQENISYLIIFGPSPTRKSPVSCLMRKSHDPRENLMSFPYRVPPNEKISCLLSHEKISCPKRKSHVFSVLAPPQWENHLSPVSWENLMSQEKISCVKRISHILSFLVPPQRENLLSPVSWENLMTQEKILCLFSIGSPPMRKSPISCLMRKSCVPRENLIPFQF